MTATIYWSEVATLVTPASWHVIGTTPPVNVPQGDTLVVVGPLTWPAGQIPATGHYCFVGLLHHAQDPAPPIPGPSDWNGFTGMIRNQNNVTWRNFNVVDEIPDPDADPAALPFVIVAAPDRAREFELQILRNLPRDARVRLEVPLGLAAKLKRGRLWKVEVDRKRRCAIIDLPPLPRLDFGNIRLGAAARFKASNRSRSASRRIRACPRHTAANGHRPPRPNTGDDMRVRLSRLRRSRQFVRVYGLVSRRPSALQNL